MAVVLAWHHYVGGTCSSGIVSITADECGRSWLSVGNVYMFGSGQ